MSPFALSPFGGTSLAWRFGFSVVETGSSLYEAEMSRTLSFSNSASGRAAPIGRVRFRTIRERRLKLAPLVLAVLASEFERDVPGNMAVEGSGMRVPAGAWVSRAQLASTCSCKLATKQTVFLWKMGKSVYGLSSRKNTHVREPKLSGVYACFSPCNHHGHPGSRQS